MLPTIKKKNSDKIGNSCVTLISKVNIIIVYNIHAHKHVFKCINKIQVGILSKQNNPKIVSAIITPTIFENLTHQLLTIQAIKVQSNLAI